MRIRGVEVVTAAMGWRVVFLIAVACLATGLAVAEKVRYDNYKVYDIVPKSTEQVEVLLAFRQLTTEFNFWTERTAVGSPVVIMVPPHKAALFSDFVKDNNLEATVRIGNLQRLIDSETTKFNARSKADFDWKSYHTLDEINAWLDSLVREEDSSKIEVVVGGTTYEKRDIKGIRITHGEKLPGVILESGIHAREWIGPAASSWIINEIINSPDDSVWRKFNYLYFPSVNPDGFQHTIDKDRMWRKTRQPYKLGPITCFGADPNRNWDYHWFEGGASNNPCAEDFAGSEAFSEVETKSLSAFYESVSSDFDIYIAFHSFSQLLMFPWGYTADHAELNDLWQTVGDKAAKDLEAVHGTTFTVGSIHDTIYTASGSSIEWYYGRFNSTFTFVFEGRDTGRYGFVLPPEQIVPSGEELQAAIETMLNEYLKL